VHRFPDILQVTVPPFARRVEGDEVIVANQARTSFLSLPPDAVEVLEWLGAGLTVGAAAARYREKYRQTPDLEDLLTVLSEEGFVILTSVPDSHTRMNSRPHSETGGPDSDLAGGADTVGEPARGTTDLRQPALPAQRRYHFDNIPETFARRIFGRPALAIAGVVVALGVLAFALDPSVLPSPTVLVFEHDQLSLFLAWIALSLLGVFIHEMAHLVGARAAGVPSRLGLGNRLWNLVAETDMTSIWLASRRQRCLAFLAGPLADLASAAVLMLLVFAVHRQWLELNPTLLVLIQATLFQYLARLLWQFEFFVPTDFYYVIGALSGCKNLMQDTQSFLLNQLARAWRQLQVSDLSAIPPRELRIVRLFSVVWLLGRAVAIATLCWITLPILIGYWVMIARGVGADSSSAQHVFPGLFPLVVVALQTTGLAVWVRGLVRAATPALTPKEGTMP
jgi:hypothetical protein